MCFFDCNVCLETASNPVITHCGHLYCWPCVYKWMRASPENATCPVCKAGLSEERIVPIYGRGRPRADPRKDSRCRDAISDELDVPARPRAQRPLGSPANHSPQQQQLRQRQQHQHQAAVTHHRRLPSWGDGWGGGVLGGGADGAGSFASGVSALPSLLGLHSVFPPAAPAPSDDAGAAHHDADLSGAGTTGVSLAPAADARLACYPLFAPLLIRWSGHMHPATSSLPHPSGSLGDACMHASTCTQMCMCDCAC